MSNVISMSARQQGKTAGAKFRKITAAEIAEMQRLAASNSDWIFRQRPCAAAAALTFATAELEAAQMHQMTGVQFASTDAEKYGVFMRYQQPIQNYHSKIMHANTVISKAFHKHETAKTDALFELMRGINLSVGKDMDKVIEKRNLDAGTH